MEGSRFKTMLGAHTSYLLQREFDCLKTNAHPNIIKVHDWIEDPSSKNAAFTMTQYTRSMERCLQKIRASLLQRASANYWYWITAAPPAFTMQDGFIGI